MKRANIWIGCAILILVSARPALAQEDEATPNDLPCPIISAPAKFELKGESADNSSNPGNRGIIPKGFVGLGSAIPVAHGIDVSKYQASADFVRVKKCGGAFAYIRMSAGTRLDNELEYRSHWSNARSVGLFVGPYHNLTIADPKRSASKLSHEEREHAEENAHSSARLQARNLIERLSEVLSLDAKPADASALGEPILPIALDVTARPMSQQSAEDREAFGVIYRKAICAWYDEIDADPRFVSAPKILFTLPALFHDFQLGKAECISKLRGIWISHRPSDGAAFSLTKESDRLNKELCQSSNGTNRCIFEQYTSWGGFALYQPTEGLDLNRFLGSKSDLSTLQFQVRR